MLQISSFLLVSQSIVSADDVVSPAPSAATAITVIPAIIVLLNRRSVRDRQRDGMAERGGSGSGEEEPLDGKQDKEKEKRLRRPQQENPAAVLVLR